MTGLSRLFFSGDDVFLGFLLFERPNGKHQHIAIQEQVSDRYALGFWVQNARKRVQMDGDCSHVQDRISAAPAIPRISACRTDARCYLWMRRTDQ